MGGVKIQNHFYDINQKMLIQPTTYFVVCRKKCFHLKVNFGNYVLQKHFYGIAVYASFDFWYLFWNMQIDLLCYIKPKEVWIIFHFNLVIVRKVFADCLRPFRQILHKLWMRNICEILVVSSLLYYHKFAICFVTFEL